MGVNDDRNVTVRLGLSVRDYLAGGAAVDAMNRRMQASQRDLGDESEKTSRKITKAGKDVEKASAGTARGLLMTSLAVGALGGAGGALKVIPPVLAAVGTGAAALPGMLGGAIDSAIVLKVGLAGISKELGAIYKVKDPFARLTPNAKNFLSQAERIKPALQGFQTGLQSRLMKGTGADLQLLATKTLPAVRGQLNKLADDWSATFAEMALSFSDQQVTGAFNNVAGGADRFFDQVNARIRPTAHAIAELVTESQPVADQVGKSLVGMLDRFNAKVAEAKRTGSLATFFEAGAAAAREMADIAGDVLKITGMIVSETAKQSAAIGGAASTLNAYLASGRAAGDIAGIVHTLTTAYDGLASTVGPLASVLRDAFADPGTAASIQQMFAVLAAGSQVLSTVLQIFLQLNGALGGLPLTAIAFAVAISKVKVVVEQATAATARGAAAMEAYGGAVGKAGARLPGLVNGLGKAAIAWVALDAAHSVIASWKNDAVDVEGMAASVEKLGKSGQVSGEMTRDFGSNLDDLGVQFQMVKAAQDNAFAGFVAGAEKAIPIAGDLATLLGSPATFTGSKENLDALDKSLVDYAKSTGDAAAVQAVLHQVMDKTKLGWGDLQKALPQTSAQLGQMSIATEQLASGTQGLAERQALLNAPLRETVTLGRSLLEVFNQLNGTNIGFAQATIAAEQAVDQLHDGLKANGLALDANKRGFDTNTEKGRQNLTLTLGLAEAASKAAQARLDDNGTVEQAATVYDAYINRLRATLAAQGATPAMINQIVSQYAQMPAALQGAAGAANDLSAKLNSIPKGTRFTFDGTSLVDGKGKTLELAGELKGIPAGRTFTWNGKNLVDGKGKAVDLKKAIQDIPGSKSSRITTPGIDPATGKVKGLAEELQGMPDGIASIHVNNAGALAAIRQVRQSLANLGGSVVPVPNRHGGLYTRAAADGLIEPQIAPPGTRYQWAEPETGGEAFIPRRGDQNRGRAIIGQAAEWYGMRTVPMVRGGVVAAAGGLVNVAPSTASTTTRATPLAYAQAYLQARDAVQSLNDALKANGRSFSLSTVKGRENRSAVYSAITAAQDAAKTKFDETGSVTKANAAYATYIARLRSTLQQQKVNSSTIRGLLSLASRPVYDINTTAAPKNSLANIAYAKAAISAAAGFGDLRDKLSLNQVGTSLSTEGGRDNLSNILGFFETAAAAAQARFEQTKSTKAATALYNTYVGQLRGILKAAGYPASTINSLVSSYGHITLNRAGGVYMAAGGLSGPSIYPPGDSPMYGFAEPGTGGEAFIPRNGDTRRGRDLLDTAAGWYGGRFVAGGAGGGDSGTTINNNLTVTPLSYNPTTAELLGHLRLMDAQARTGRRR